MQEKVNTEPYEKEHEENEQQADNKNQRSARNGTQMSELKHLSPFALETSTLGLKKEMKIDTLMV